MTFDLYYIPSCVQVCRAAYELMQTKHGDASNYFKSLDDIYYFHGQHAHNFEVVKQHSTKDINGLPLALGDLVAMLGNHWDGYSLGTNQRTKMTALFPSYKVENKINIVKMPTYHDADGL
jgi:glycoprotein 6-alpha-L-fucosyltransferase